MSDKSLDEVTISEKEIYAGRIVHLYERTVRLPNGKTSFREIVKHQGAVAIIIHTPDDKIIFVKQYRSAVEAELLEVPAGKRDPGETFLVAAKREMREETGLAPLELIPLGEIFSSPGFSNEKLALYYCRKYTKETASLDDDEFLKTEAIPVSEVKRRIASGELHDAKTLAIIAICQVKGLIK